MECDPQPTEVLALHARVHDIGRPICLASDGMRRWLGLVQMRFKLEAVAA